MKNINLQFEGISKNLRYIFTDKGIHDLVSDKSMKYESLSLIDGINILQEVQNYEYKSGQITLQEHTSNPRRAMITLSNMLLPDNSITVLKEWENHYGNKLLMINESIDNLIIESRINEAWNGVKIMINEYWGESAVNWVGDTVVQGAKAVGGAIKSGANWVVDQGKQIADKGIVGYVGEKSKKVWNWIKEKATAAWNCLTGSFVECLMENLRSVMYSVVGIAVETFLAVTGIGAPIPMVLWGLMLIWDVYKMFSGKYAGGEYAFSWVDILFDVLGIAFAGALGSVLAPIRAVFKGVGGGIAGIFAKGVKMGGKVGGAFKSIGSFLAKSGSKIMGAIQSGAQWISKNFGISFLERWVGKAKGVVDDIAKVATKGKVGSVLKAGGEKAGSALKAGGEKAGSTFGNIKKGYSKAFDNTIGKVGANTKMGKTTLGKALSSTAQTAVPVGIGMSVLGIDPLTGKPYDKGGDESNGLEKNLSALTTGTADYSQTGMYS
jgi:hypothetical protein